MKDTYVDGEKLARNGQKTATYIAASFLPHYRRVLFSHLLVFNLCQIQVKTKLAKECQNSNHLTKSFLVWYENTLWDFVAFKIGHCPQNGADFMPTCSWKE